MKSHKAFGVSKGGPRTGLPGVQAGLVMSSTPLYDGEHANSYIANGGPFRFAAY